MTTLTSAIFFLILAITLQFSTQNHTLNTLNQDIANLPSTDSPSKITPGRTLLTITRNPIRITLDSSSYSSISSGLNGASATTSTNLAFILKAMQVAVNFYMVRIKTYPISSLKAPGTCIDYTPSTNDQTFGISASDLHIYVLYTTNKTGTYGATGGACKWVEGSLPDTTLQVGRPVIGRIIFNTYLLVDQQTSLTNMVFQSVTSTALHQIMHILGFDSNRYSTWLISDQTDPSFGNVYTATTSAGGAEIHSSRPSTTYLITPYVTAWAKDFFDCSTLTGMLLQNQDGSGLGGGSHWQRLAMYDEVMTATSLGTTVKYFSGLTFAILKDMGWYTVDDTFNQTSNYGYKKGCSFVLEGCYSSTSFSEFCDASSMSGILTCQTTYYGKAICTNVADTMADSCGIFGPTSNCVDPSNTDNGYVSYTRQTFSTSSFCVSSTLGTVALPSTLTSRCYPYVCTGTNITFTIGSYSIVCQSSEVGVTKTLSAMTGTLTCPDFALFCSQTRKTCSNWCSQNGYCMGGVCNCLPGYYGVDCSKTICSTGTYYDSTTSSCVSTCPSNYYQNIYSHSCEQCDSTCQQCYGQPTICTGCISTASNPQYFYNTTCYTTCPSSTFASGFNCSVCDSAVFCQTCSITATNCTSCSANGNTTMYLNQPNFGSCINDCPTVGTYTIRDVVNKVCVGTCAENLILTNNTCDYCPGGQFKLISNSSCVSSCPDYFYPDSTNYLCSQCDTSCLTCSGQYAQNCTSCSSTATLRYLLLNMCWSICPGGYYSNDTDNKCYICPTSINCGNCTYSNSTNTVICTTCSYGYFLQASLSTCVSACNSTQFAFKANNTCMQCDSGCASCDGPSNSTCLSCAGGLMYVKNLTGKYCISACSSVGYTASGTNCLDCDVSCYTCSGTSNSACTSCSNGSYLSSSYCRLVCPAATYPNTTTNVCSACDGSCTFCFGPTINNCTGCISGMVLYNFTCTLSCPQGYTVNQWNVCFQTYLKLSLLFLLIVMF